MYRSSRVFLLSFLFLLLLQPLTFGADTWLRVRSKNFELIGNASEKDIRRVATRLEQFREVFSQLFGNIKLNSPIPTTVIVFKSEKSFTPYKPVSASGKTTKWVAGYFRPGEDINYVVLTTEGENANTFRTIYHEYMHYLVDNNLGKSSIPPWFNEGIAEFYETFQIEGDQKVTVGYFNQNHLNLLQQSKLIPLETFFDIDYYSLHQQGSDGAGLFYAQAWAFVHYLMLGNPARRNQLSVFLNLVLNKTPPKDAFQKAFNADYPALEQELRQYARRSSYTGMVYTLKQKLTYESEMQTTPLTEAQSQAYLGNLLYAGRQYDAAITHLNAALAADPQSASANATMGLIHLKKDNYSQALKYLDIALKLGGGDYLTNYQYAYVLSRAGMSEYGFVSGYTGETAEKMKSALKRSIELRPDFVRAYELYAFVSIVRNEGLDEAVSVLQKALEIAPGNEWNLIRMAELQMRKENFAEARKYAKQVFENASDESVRLYAQSTIRTIDSSEQQLNAIKDYNSRPRQRPTLNVPEKPLTEAELAAAQEKATLDAINSQLRKPGSGEARVLGRITKIECLSGQIFYHIKTENEIIKLQSETFQTLSLMAFNVAMNGISVGCGSDLSKNLIVITYKASTTPKAKTKGELISLEFVPENFKLYD